MAQWPRDDSPQSSRRGLPCAEDFDVQIARALWELSQAEFVVKKHQLASLEAQQGVDGCRCTVTSQLAAVNDSPGKVVVRKMSGDEGHITPNRPWQHPTVMSLRSQLAELDVVDDVSENFVGRAGISVVASHISVVFGDRIAALHQLVATLWDSNFLSTNCSPLSHPLLRDSTVSVANSSS